MLVHLCHSQFLDKELFNIFELLDLYCKQNVRIMWLNLPCQTSDQSSDVSPPAAAGNSASVGSLLCVDSHSSCEETVSCSDQYHLSTYVYDNSQSLHP